MLYSFIKQLNMDIFLHRCSLFQLVHVAPHPSHRTHPPYVRAHEEMSLVFNRNYNREPRVDFIENGERVHFESDFNLSQAVLMFNSSIY